MKNFKTNVNRPALSDEEIAAGKNFNAVFKSYQAARPSLFKTPKFWFGASALITASIVGVVLVSKMKTDSINATPFINPPIANADIKSDNYIINAQTDSVITYTSGSKIHIPANAFLDENGKIAEGNVELRYREFTKPSEVFLAGIPMTYDSAGETFHFETAGMMEISAEQNGKKLFTNPNAIIKVDMVSNNPEDRFNTYYLDTAEKNWKYLPQCNFNMDVKEVLANMEKHDKKAEKKNAKLEKAKKEIAQLEKEKPVAPKKIDKDKPRFKISVDEKEFPEIAIYNGLKFQVEDKTYDADKANTLWENVEMKRIEGSINYEITFSNSKENYTVVATPVFEDKDYNDAKKIYDQKYAEYQTKLAKRKTDESKLKEEMEARAKTIEEKIKKEIEAQVQRRKEYEARLAQSDLVYRSFQVQNFGVWNCDCPARLPQGQVVAATLSDAKTNHELSIQTCYLVEKGRNVMFTYSGGGLKTFRYDSTKENLIWAVTTDLKVAVLKADDFRAQAKSGNFKMEVLDRKFGSSDEVKEYLEI